MLVWTCPRALRTALNEGTAGEPGTWQWFSTDDPTAPRCNECAIPMIVATTDANEAAEALAEWN